MVCTASAIIDILSKLAPEETAEPYDSVGLQLGTRRKAVSRLLLALEITSDVVDEAGRIDADMIVTHHPLFFRAVNAIDEDTPTGSLAARLIRMNTAVYAMHTNLDKAEDGVNDQLMNTLHAGDIMVPPGQSYIRVGNLPERMKGCDFAGYIAACLGARSVAAVGEPPEWIRRIAVGSGASGDMIETVAGAGVDAFVVGEIKYHQAQEARERGVYTVAAGHFETEWPVLAFLKKHLQNTLFDLQYKMEVKVSSENKSPFGSVK